VDEGQLLGRPEAVVDGHDRVEIQPANEGPKPGHGVADPEQGQAEPGDLVPQPGNGADRQVEAVSLDQDAVIEEAEKTVRRPESRLRGRRREDRGIGDVHHDAALGSRDPAPDQGLSPVMADGDHVIGETAGGPFLPGDQAPEPGVPPSEAAGEEFRHEVVKVEDHGDAPPLEASGAENEEIREIVDLDRIIGMGAMEELQSTLGGEEKAAVVQEPLGKALELRTAGEA
jgi:hypothetical protein